MNNFKSSWTFLRVLTIDLLMSLSDEDLLWAPGDEVGTLWKQFRHVGRVQENYIDALQTGKINFSCESRTYNGGPDRKALVAYLNQQDDLLFQQLAQIDLNQTIDWFGEPVTVDEHLSRLASHETLHHGQWIIYCKLRDKTFPKSWAVWGL